MAWKRESQMSAVKPRFGVRASYSRINFGSNQRLRSQKGQNQYEGYAFYDAKVILFRGKASRYFSNKVNHFLKRE